MVATADILVESRDGIPQLVVETKGKVPASSEWAAIMRRNLSAHSAAQAAPFFLLVLPERFYLWKNAQPNSLVQPDYQGETRAVFGRYLENLSVPIQELTEASLELLVRSWLYDVIDLKRSDLPAASTWLAESGLYDAIRKGNIRSQATA